MAPTGEQSPDNPVEPDAAQLVSAEPNTIIILGDGASASQQTTEHLRGQVTDPATPATINVPPAAFGRYQVHKTLGAGGFGTVYLGHDSELDRPVAIKVLNGGPDMPQARSDQFLAEARRLGRLRHPGILTVHDVGVQEGRIYLVSDFLEGPSLAGWLKSNRPRWQDAARLAATVADALAHAHSRLVVHRDVKPDNIVLIQGGTPVLVDFGLGLDDSASNTKLGTISGTPGYMSPEQVAGAAHRIDGRTDIYSLGVVLYELLTGRVPFRSNEIKELLRQMRDDEPQPPRQLVQDIPPELERVCLKAMAKRMQDRYTTAADFAEDLGRVQNATNTGQSWSSGISLATNPSGDRPASQSWPSRSGGPTPASVERRIRDAERRQVTVLVCGCELLQSEEFLESVEAEEQAEVLRALQRTCEQAAHRFDGTVVQSSAEGVVICFGYPLAHEDTARRAAQVGLNILEDLQAVGEAFRLKYQMELRPRVTIHTGPAVVQTDENAISLVGEARNVAVRLEDVAEPDQVVCSDATYRLIQRHFECESLGSRKIKGVPQPMELFRVQEVSESRNAIEAAEPAGLTPLTGRDHEVSLLKDRWEQAQEGMGQVVLLIGEPGLGKSRLVHTLKQHVLEEQDKSVAALASRPSSVSAQNSADSPVVEWRCAPHFQNTALYSPRDFFERFLGLGREKSPADRFDRLVRHLDEYDLARRDVVPLFASLLSLSPDERFPPLGLSPVREREDTFRALREWLRAYSDRRPILFIVEDLHWVDSSTLEFLGQFLAEGLHDRVLTLLTFRPEFQTPWPAMSHQTSLALNRLTRRQVGDLIREQTGTPDLADALIEQVYDRAGGVPLFVEEFTKMLQETGAPSGAADVGKRIQSLPSHEIPATLQDLVMARLDRLAGDREVGQLAATLGREFSYELLSAVSSMDEPTLQAELAKLIQAEILYQKGRPPRCTYIFKHALLEDAAYNSLIKVKRQQFHRRIAEVLEARFPQTVEKSPELLAHHYSQAGLAEQAIGYWLKAGLGSRSRSAETEAINYLKSGLVLLETIKESPARDALELDVLSSLGTAYIASRGYASPDVGPVFHRARELCERVGKPHQLFALMLGIWEWHTVRADLRLCMELATEGMEFASRQNDPGMLMEALFMLGETMLYRADFAGARANFEKAVTEYDHRERTKFWAEFTSHNAGVTHRSNLAVSLWHLGYPDQALEVNREMRQLAREIGHPFSLAYALHHTSWLYQRCRMGAEVQAAAEEQLAIATEQGFALWRATGTFFSGAGMLLQGKLDEALPLLLKSSDAFRASGAELTVPFQLSIEGEAYLQAGRFEDARRVLDEGLALAEKNDERCQEPELHRLKGELLLAESHDQASLAEACFHQAIESARRQQSQALELRATLSLARLWKWQDRRNEARIALATIYDAYTEGFTAPDLMDAKSLLDTLA